MATGPDREQGREGGGATAVAGGGAGTARVPRLILASTSPRRRALLSGAGFSFETRAPDVSERVLPGEAPRVLVERLARAKALAVARRAGDAPGRLALGSDTVVVLDGAVLGKPRDPEHAVGMLRRLRGRVHEVWTGVAVVETGTGRCRSIAVSSRVHMRHAEESELRAYVAGGEPLDKAGAYAFQGEGRTLVIRVEGSESNVIGLPLDETLALLLELGLEPG